MTREEAITKYIVPAIEKIWNDKRCKEILEALEREPCEDTISRQAAIKYLMDNMTWYSEDGYETDEDEKKSAITSLINGVPSIQPVMGDLISRQDAIRIAEQGQIQGYEWQFKQLTALPSVTGKWIPVSERLPEDEQEILFSTKTGRVHSGKYHDDDSANQWYSHRDKARAWNNVVNAWMPLPKAYKEVN